MWTRFALKTLWCKLFETQNPIANLRQKTCRNAAGRARGHYGAGSALQGPHTARPNQSSVGMASTNPRGGSMGLQGPPYAVLSPLVTDPLAPPGDPESSLFLTCHFVLKGSRRVHQNRRNGQNSWSCGVLLLQKLVLVRQQQQRVYG